MVLVVVLVVVVVVVVVVAGVAAATSDQAAAQLRGFRTGLGRNFCARGHHQAPFRTVKVCAASEPCASPFCYRCRSDPPGPNSWAQTLLKRLHHWVGGRVSTSAQWRESLGFGLLMKAADGADAYSALTQVFLYQKERHDTCLPTGSSSTAKPERSDTVAERQIDRGGQVLTLLQANEQLSTSNKATGAGTA